MLTPSAFERVRIDDYSVAPFTVHKSFYIDRNNAQERGYTVRNAIYSKKDLPIGLTKGSIVYAPTSSDGSFNYLNWRSINQLYYRNPYDSVESLEGFNYNNTFKHLFVSASIISAPFNDIGEGFKAGSIVLSSSGFILQDDRKNNLVDTLLDSSSFLDTSELNGYWGFQNLYLRTPNGTGFIHYDHFDYISNTHGENLQFVASNIGVSEGIEVGGVPSGTKIDLTTSKSYIYNKHVKEFNYETGENFCISFWLKAPVSQSNLTSPTNTLINKRTYADFSTLGLEDVLLDSGDVVQRKILNTKTEYKPIDIFPYHFEIYNNSHAGNGKIVFSRSDGSYTSVITSSIAVNDGFFHHVCANKSGSNISLFIDGLLQGSTLDVTDQPTNDYHIIFGAWDLNGARQFSGSLDEIRFYNTFATPHQISSSLAEKTSGLLYQTCNVGNVFYRRGEIVVSSPIAKYNHGIAYNQWALQYKNNYTIYEYETLVRIKAGTYNKTMNPTSIKSPKSNLYLDDFITGSLRPYVTTVGLYNEKLQLVAVGKLGRPLKMRDDVDINLIVRWDY